MAECPEHLFRPSNVRTAELMAAAEVASPGLVRALPIACYLCSKLVDLVEAARDRVPRT